MSRTKGVGCYLPVESMVQLQSEHATRLANRVIARMSSAAEPTATMFQYLQASGLLTEAQLRELQVRSRAKGRTSEPWGTKSPAAGG